MIRRGRTILLLAPRLCVVTMLVACLCLSLLPRSAIVSASGLNSCCQGQSAGHCTISLRKIRRAPKPEPMCGAKSSESGGGVTIIAEDNQTPSQSQTAIARPDPCNYCPTCTLGSKQGTRDKSFLPTQQPVRTVLNSDHLQKVCVDTLRSLNQFKPVNPRGPPHT
jgi:hypothetical protein